jgi:Ca2+:H+ antiporter
VRESALGTRTLRRRRYARKAPGSGSSTTSFTRAEEPAARSRSRGSPLAAAPQRVTVVLDAHGLTALATRRAYLEELRKRARRRAESNRCRGLCRPLPGPLGHAAWRYSEDLTVPAQGGPRASLWRGLPNGHYEGASWLRRCNVGLSPRPKGSLGQAAPPQMPHTPERPGRGKRRLPLGSPTWVAAALLPATVGAEEGGAPHVAVFVIAAVALAALAAVVGTAIEQVGERLGPGPTGLLQSSLGNLPELLVAIFALRAGLTSVVQAALVGSVLSNVLLVLGVAFLSGAARHGTQRFRPEAPRMLVTLLTLAVGSMLVPTLAVKLDTPAVHHSTALSEATAVVLLVVYLASIPFWLEGGPLPAHQAHGARTTGPPAGARPPVALASPHTAALKGPRASASARPRPASPGAPWPLPLAVGLLGAASVASGFVSDWFVSSLTPATTSLGISPVFTGLVIVAIASNAVENAVGIRFAWKARPDYAISTVLNSPLQIALLLTPVLVLASPAIGPAHLTLVFPPLLVAALAVAVIVVAIVVYDGEYSWLEGAALIALYTATAAAFWWG